MTLNVVDYHFLRVCAYFGCDVLGTAEHGQDIHLDSFVDGSSEPGREKSGRFITPSAVVQCKSKISHFCQP